MTERRDIHGVTRDLDLPDPEPAPDDGQAEGAEVDEYSLDPRARDSLASYGDGVALRDCQEFDGTDAAHPAWWRGHDRVEKKFRELVDELRAKLAKVGAALEEEQDERRRAERLYQETDELLSEAKAKLAEAEIRLTNAAIGHKHCLQCIAGLTSELAAEEKSSGLWLNCYHEQHKRAEAAEARVKELEAELKRTRLAAEGRLP